MTGSQRVKVRGELPFRHLTLNLPDLGKIRLPVISITFYKLNDLFQHIIGGFNIKNIWESEGEFMV